MTCFIAILFASSVFIISPTSNRALAINTISDTKIFGKSNLPTQGIVIVPVDNGYAFVYNNTVLTGITVVRKLEARTGGLPVYCTNLSARPPEPDTSLTIATLTAPTVTAPQRLRLTTAQMAYLLGKYQESRDRDVQAALAYLVHANFEQPVRKQDYALPTDNPQELVDWLISFVSRELPQVDSLATNYVLEARKSAAVGYQKGQVTGQGKRKGTISNLGITNEAGEYLAGKKIKITLIGPAVFTATKTANWSGYSKDIPVSLDWEATGNGAVTANLELQTEKKSFEIFDAEGKAQNTLLYRKNKSIFETQDSSLRWNVIYDFQPIGISEATKISDDGSLTDILSVQADPDYGSGTWFETEKGYVPVDFIARAYVAGDLPPMRLSEIPDTAQQVGEVVVRANGPSQIKATFTDLPPGFITVVWSMKKQEQGENQRYLHGDWQDDYGIPEETTSHRRQLEIDTSLSVRETKSGTYLVDDVFISGFPINHGEFKGDSRFIEDALYLDQELWFFPEGITPAEENINFAQKIGETFQVPAKNGYHPNVGALDFKAIADVEGKLIPGTYVFQTSFSGDSRVKPYRSEFSDKYEHFIVTDEPSLQTSLRFIDGTKTKSGLGKQKVIDEVCYFGLRSGAEYELRGQLVAKTSPTSSVVEQRKVFVPKSSHGCTEVEFSVDLSAVSGQDLVSFQELWLNNNLVVKHSDINDLNQTVSIGLPVSLRTVATDAEDNDKFLQADANAKIIDIVCDANKQLVPGVEYLIETDVVRTSNGETVLTSPVNSIFQPKHSADCARIEVEFDARDLAGEEVVVFERVLQRGEVITEHHDLKEKSQTVRFQENPAPKIPTLPLTGANAVIGILSLLLLIGAGGGLIYLRLKQ
ncbi:MAG: VaFE repeat-containing surface-anchored protein [Arcanobacterium sp.]|nr:VaFE repeat-containing surface-anchored protein [Arcanobacterium sp.]